MCGIAGSLGRPELVPALVKGLRHRGPDHAGWRVDGELAVGASRLRVTGDARGDMPLLSTSGNVVVALNGEIFNHEDLFGRDHGSDVVGLPDLLERDGPEALSRIRGPFALVAYDLRDRSLLVARDEYGVRPLFVHEARGSVAAASEVGALADLVGPLSRDERAWDHLLAFQFWPPDRTPWADLTPVPPGTWRRFELEGSGCVRTEGRIAYVGGGDDLGRAVQEAFTLQASSGLKTGITLSGGLDSSVVLGGVLRAGASVDVAVTGWFPASGAAFDERPWARAVARESGVPLREVGITADAYLEAWPKVLRAMGGPLAGPGAASQWLLCRALADEGVGVVFSGQGGDELFGGYERHRQLLQRDLGVPLDPAPGYERLLAAGADSAGVDLASAALYRGRALLPYVTPERARGMERARQTLPGGAGPIADRLLEYEIGTLLPGLLAVDDRTSAAFGMEGRVPLLDPVIGRLARREPLSVKSPPSSPRSLFRAVTRTLLPDAVAERRDKMGFPVPLDEWFAGPWRALRHDHPGLGRLTDVGFRPEVQAALASGSLRGRDAWFVLSVAFALESAATPSAASEVVR